MLLYALSLLATREGAGGIETQHRPLAVIALDQAAAQAQGVQIAQREYPPAAGWTCTVRTLEIIGADGTAIFTTDDDPPRLYEIHLTVAPREAPRSAQGAARRPLRPAPPLDEATAVLDEDKRWGGEGG